MFFSWYQKRIFTLKKLFSAQIGQFIQEMITQIIQGFLFASKSEKTLTWSNFTNVYSALSSVVSNGDELVAAFSDEINSSLEKQNDKVCNKTIHATKANEITSGTKPAKTNKCAFRISAHPANPGDTKFRFCFPDEKSPFAKGYQ